MELRTRLTTGADAVVRLRRAHPAVRQQDDLTRIFDTSTIVEVLNSGGVGVMGLTKQNMPETM